MLIFAFPTFSKHAMHKRGGFSLIELMIVIGIITVITAAGATRFTQAQAKSRDARRQADLEAVRSALELYRSDNSTIGYPNPSGGSADSRYDGLCAGSSCDSGELLYNYLERMPQDPRENATYFYMYTRVGSGTSYTLCANDFEATYGTPPAQCPADYTISGTNCCLAPP